MNKRLAFVATILIILASACSTSNQTQEQPVSDPVALTTSTFLADIVRNVAGDRVTVGSLLPVGVDPHSYQPTPRDVAKLEKCKILIVNGAGYEQFLSSLLQNVSGGKNVIEASAGIGQGKDAGGVDPHFWLDPNHVIVYVENIRIALTEYDPDGAALYKSNADAYTAQLRELDSWIADQVSQIPSNKRILITNHEALGYFAKRYGFDIAGSVIPSFSGNAAPSAQEMARLIDTIRNTGAPAIFLDAADNDILAKQIADETGIRVITDLHLESLTDGAPAATYIDMMKYNVTRIVDAIQ